jgi:hypothetical protein
MFLPDKAVKEFQDIYHKKVGEKISFEEARIKAEDFLRLFDLITKPINKNKNESENIGKLR